MMDHDFYLHNNHVMNARNATTFMREHERAFCINFIEEDDEVGSPGKLHCIGSTPSTDATVILESERVARVRKHCTKQNLVLSSWWKAALQANLKEKNLLRFGTTHDTNTLPGRFDRVYQPDKLTQFDRVFSRAWETPVRRSHAAQHTEGADGDDTCDFTRVMSVDLLASSRVKPRDTMDDDLRGISIRELVATHDFSSNSVSKLKTFAKFFDDHDATISQDDNLEPTNPPIKYRQYCDLMSGKVHDHSWKNVEEFNEALHDLSLSADDVAGICEASEIQIIHILSYSVFCKAPTLPFPYSSLDQVISVTA